MFYCPNCNNIFDITRSIETKQTGGKSTDTEGEKTSSKSQDPLIEKLLANKATQSDVINLNLNDFIKSQSYKSLENSDRELVFNRIQDLLPNDKKKLMEFKNNVDEQANTAFFICTNCGHARKIENGTLIFSKKSENITQSYDIGDYADLKYSSILPRTRNYICVNKQCESHKNMQKKRKQYFLG